MKSTPARWLELLLCAPAITEPAGTQSYVRLPRLETCPLSTALVRDGQEDRLDYALEGQGIAF